MISYWSIILLPVSCEIPFPVYSTFWNLELTVFSHIWLLTQLVKEEEPLALHETKKLRFSIVFGQNIFSEPLHLNLMEYMLGQYIFWSKQAMETRWSGRRWKCQGIMRSMVKGCSRLWWDMPGRTTFSMIIKCI